MKLSTLKNRQDFVEMSKEGSKIATRGVVVECFNGADTETFEDPKFGFTASRKVGGSVYRNKAKRRLRESVRHVFDKSPGLFKKGYRYNFIARHSTIERPFENLVKDIKFALHNIEKDEDER